uniref:Cytochrome c n=1 Tax=Roseihalotalea indica TaxID=2867963 RepID=A0AA49GMJ1_9BACT|nr:cytochrome c [Tunicatimonas sp. TK19036]
MSKYHIYYVFIVMIALAGCEAQGDYQGLEYAPQMYHSTPYEPLTQITDEDAGSWLSSLDNGVGEFYNSNPYNPYRMNSRVPPANTVRRNADDFLPYRIPADSIELASRVLKNPLDSTDAVLKQGQALYNQYCYPCHGGAGQGDGPVGVVYKGVPAYNKGRYRDMTEGHIFHTITWGRGRMNPHGSQVDIADRWKIVRYVQTLQQQ